MAVPAPVNGQAAVVVEWDFDPEPIKQKMKEASNTCVTVVANAAKLPASQALSTCYPTVPAPVVSVATGAVVDKVADVAKNIAERGVDTCYKTPDSLGSRVALKYQ